MSAIFLQLKGLRFSALVPPIVLFVVLPALFIPLLEFFGPSEDTYRLVLQCIQTVMPFFSVWWIIFISKEYIENDGNELLFTFKPKTLWRKYLIFFIFYLFLAFFVFLIFSYYYPAIWWEYVRFFCIALMFFGGVYALMYATGSIALTFLVIMMIIIINMTVPDQPPNPIYYICLLPFDRNIFLTVCLPQLIIAVILFIIGIISNKRFRKYR